MRSSGDSGKPCVPGLQDVFRRISRSAYPDVFDSTPHVVSATVNGDRASVVISGGYQKRHLVLTRRDGRWRITGSPDIG